MFYNERVIDEGQEIYMSEINRLSWIAEELDILKIRKDQDRRKFIMICKNNLSIARRVNNE